MLTILLIKWNLPSSFYLDVTRRYFTLFAIRTNQVDWLPFEILKGNYSLKRKKQLVSAGRENSCMLKEAVTASYFWKRDIPQFYQQKS